jgi:hypothetical protein
MIGLVDLEDFVIDDVFPNVVFEIAGHIVLLGCDVTFCGCPQNNRFRFSCKRTHGRPPGETDLQAMSFRA